MSTNFPFDVKVIDGEGLPVSSVEVGVRYKYESGPRTWSADIRTATVSPPFATIIRPRPST